MAANKNANKIVYGGKTLIDLTADTVTKETLISGYTAHDKSGAKIIGTATAGGSSGMTEKEYAYEVAKRLSIDAYVGQEKTSSTEKCIGSASLWIYVDGSKIKSITFYAEADKHTTNSYIDWSSEDYNESWEDAEVYFSPTTLKQEFTIKTHTVYEDNRQHNESLLYLSFNGSGSFIHIHPKSITMQSGVVYTFASAQSYVDHFVELFGHGYGGNYYIRDYGDGYRNVVKKMLLATDIHGYISTDDPVYCRIPFYYPNNIKSITYKFTLSQAVFEGACLASSYAGSLYTSDDTKDSSLTSKTITVDYSKCTEKYDTLTVSTIMSPTGTTQKYSIAITDVQFKD